MKIKNFNQSIITAVILILTGIAFIAFPTNALNVALRIIGALLLIWEIYKIYSIAKSHGNGYMLTLFLINEVFTLLFSIILIVNPLGAINTLALILGIYLAINGGITLYKCLNVRTEASARPWFSIILAVIILIVGFWLMFYPSGATRLTAIFIGVALIVKGVELLLSQNGNDSKGDYFTDDFVDKS